MKVVARVQGEVVLVCCCFMGVGGVGGGFDAGQRIGSGKWW